MTQSVMIHYLGGACGDLLKVCVWLGISGSTISSRTKDIIRFSPMGQVRLNEKGRLLTLDCPVNRYGDPGKASRHDIEQAIQQKLSPEEFSQRLIEKYNYYNDIYKTRTTTDVDILNGHEIIEFFKYGNSRYAEPLTKIYKDIFYVNKNVVIKQDEPNSSRIQLGMSQTKNNFGEVNDFDEYHNRTKQAINNTIQFLENVCYIELEDMLKYETLIEFLNSEFGIEDNNKYIKLLLSFWTKAQGKDLL